MLWVFCGQCLDTNGKCWHKVELSLLPFLATLSFRKEKKKLAKEEIDQLKQVEEKQAKEEINRLKHVEKKKQAKEDIDQIETCREEQAVT